MKTITIFIITLVISTFAFSSNSYAVDLELHFTTPEQQQRYEKLISELRCLVCQNQNLADSNADLAKDLRSKTYNMVTQGKDDKEIIAYMRDRYGDFVLYRPPFNRATALLWAGPFIILIITLLLLFRHIKKRQHEQPNHNKVDHDQNTDIQNLLKDTPTLSSDRSQMRDSDKTSHSDK